MCNRYKPTRAELIRDYHGIDPVPPETYSFGEVFPRSLGPFMRRARESSSAQREAVIGRWGLVPWFAKTSQLGYSTNNARFEEISNKASFKQAWARGQRCVIPAEWFVEPNWESGKNQWWRFGRRDGEPWSLAGLWNTWTDKATGERVESYTMLTINADAHPLMSRMHKPDPKLQADQQDKRSVIPLEPADVGTWLYGTIGEAALLARLAPAEIFDAAPLSP